MPKMTKIVKTASGRDIVIPVDSFIIDDWAKVKLMGEEVIAQKLTAAGYKPADPEVKLTTVDGRQVYRKGFIKVTEIR
jgi:hypothetical protein